MKQWWKVQADRIDALSLRERVFLFVSLLACCMLLAEVLWLAPARTRHQQLAQRVMAQDAELQKLSETLKNSSSDAGSGKLMREELVQVKTSLEALNQEIDRVPSVALDATPLSQVLVHFLRRHEGLTLVRTNTLPGETSAVKAPQGGQASALTRQGLELTVAGPYPELIRYVQTLERALPALRWGAMKMSGDKQPPQLTLQVFLVGVAP